MQLEVDFKTTKEAVYSSRENVSELDKIITASRTLLSSNFVISRVEFRRQVGCPYPYRRGHIFR